MKCVAQSLHHFISLSLLRFHTSNENMKQQGCLYPFFGIFAIAGLVCGVVGFSMLYSRYQLMHEGVKTTGTVTNLNWSKNTVAPVVGFEDEWGNALEYHSAFYTNIDPYELGQEVVIYYDPNNPKDATLDGEGWEGWFPLIFLLTHGGVGFGGLYWLEKKRRLYKWLQEKGYEVQAQFTRVKESYNKRRYYALQCEWTDPYTKILHQFESERTAKEPPASLIPGTLIRVLIDPDNPKRYWVDTTFWD
jgi:hypothetical protein